MMNDDCDTCNVMMLMESWIDLEWVCYVLYICLLTTNKYQKYKSVELGDQLLYVYPFKKHVHSICGFNPIWCKGDKAQYQNGLILGKVANRL